MHRLIPIAVSAPNPMNQLIRIFLFLTLITMLPAGEIRMWTSSDGAKTFSAEYLSRTQTEVTLLRRDGKKLTIAINILHPEDLRWLNLNYPVSKEGKGEEMPDANAVFDTLKFGDNRQTVSAKLSASRIVETGVAGTFQGRTGLNGIYRTKHKIGGLLCFLFFDWNDSGNLIEVTLQTESQMAGDYLQVLKPCWEECIPLITSIHGNPSQKTGMPSADRLEEGQMLASHLWKLDQGGTVMLGTAREGMGYQVVVRFTKERIEPVMAP